MADEQGAVDVEADARIEDDLVHRLAGAEEELVAVRAADVVEDTDVGGRLRDPVDEADERLVVVVGREGDAVPGGRGLDVALVQLKRPAAGELRSVDDHVGECGVDRDREPA